MNKIINQGPQKNLASSIVAEQEKTCICLQAAQTQGRWVNLWNHLEGQRETGGINTHRQPGFCCHCQACSVTPGWVSALLGRGCLAAWGGRFLLLTVSWNHLVSRLLSLPPAGFNRLGRVEAQLLFL